MKLPKSAGGETINLIGSSRGQAELAKHGMTTYDLATAIKHFQAAEGVRVGTLIGVNADGFFGAKREGWRPDQPDAFSEPLISIPWAQILDYLKSEPADAEIEGPGWIQRESVVLLFSELRPSTIAEIIDCLTEQNPLDARVFSLRNLYQSITGKELG